MRPILRILTLLTAAITFQTTRAEDWYVTGAGDDHNSGKTLDAAFRTLGKAAALVQAGDTVHIGEGVYTAKHKGDNVLTITSSGKPKSWITWKAIPGTKNEVRPTGWQGIQISGSYHLLDGLNVIGANDSLTLPDAMADGLMREKNGRPYSGNSRFNSNGISVDGRKNPKDAKPHHVIIRNCKVAKCPGGGITMLDTDYVTIEDCVVYDNCWYMRYAGSGITSLHNWAFDDAPGYHYVIRRNRVWNNKTLVPWVVTGKLSDGNGILLDVTDLETNGATNPNADAVSKPKTTPKKTKSERPEWKGRTLIANNISAFNGGSGIHAFRTRHVDIVNNTTYRNGTVVHYQELFPNRCDDVVILNNIIVPSHDGKVTSSNKSTNIRWDYNLYPKKQEIFHGEHDIIADPLFIDEKRFILQLAKDSPGIDSGTSELPQAKDVRGHRRPVGKNHDRGAYEQ